MCGVLPQFSDAGGIRACEDKVTYPWSSELPRKEAQGTSQMCATIKPGRILSSETNSSLHGKTVKALGQVGPPRD